MITRPVQFVRKYLKDKIERTRKLDEFIHTQTDSFVTWIIGFSFTGLLLIVSNLDKLKTRLPTKAIVICLFISVILGIAFRIISFSITLFQKSLDDYFFGLLSDEVMTPVYLEEDINNLGFYSLLSLIKNDFGEVAYPEGIENIILSEDLIKSEEKKLREYYLYLIDRSKKELDIALNHIAEIDQKAYRINNKKNLDKLKDIKKAFETTKVGYNQKRWYRSRAVVYFLCLLSFLTAVSILCVSILMALP